MNVRAELDKLKAELEQMSVDQLTDLVIEMGIDTDAVTHKCLVDDIMAAEEHAAFH